MSTLQSDHPLGAHPGPGRAETRERLSKVAYDLLVIGGGILGTSVAWRSAQSGLRVAMVDAGDFAGATSSASSKPAHGGLRYLRTDDLKAVAGYGDHQMNDARVAVMTVRAAARSGAVVINHAEVTGLRFTHGRVTGVDVQDRLDGTEFGIDAHLVINATGPWEDHLRRMEDKSAAPASASPRAPTSSASAKLRGRPRWPRRSTSTTSPLPCRGRPTATSAVRCCGKWRSCTTPSPDPSASPTWSARTRPWASGSTPMARRSGHRSSMRETTSGRRPSTRAVPPYDADRPRSRHGRGPCRRPVSACAEGLMR
ncbi:FAD-dependent oxidoreductase [Streptomyces decoyicus]|uniref:FAD-dependent oxidoreductase n=1 Tax=Streptomyces decoyicus TaxID=249567 RepID=UPI003631B43A